MKIRLNSNLTEQVLALTNDFHYSPDEVISMGIALASVLLQEKALGNQVVVVTPNGNKVAEFKEVEPKAIHDMAKEYIQSICPDMAEAPATLLVAKLERERDFERRYLK
jgi:hypothetical protein